MKPDDRAQIPAELQRVFDSCTAACIAVSGGVDSMTLASLAHRQMGDSVTMCHAVSPAVPPAATRRVREHAAAQGWALRVIDAGEFDDERYRANPANRCFFCKTNLYASLASLTRVQLFSGTNLDDLGDWRPGLQAASDHAVRHPFVEAGIDKTTVRALAHQSGLRELADLPAAPCLSSRVETGIRIQPGILRFVDRVETLLRESLQPETVRCRVRQQGIAIELDEATLATLDTAQQSQLLDQIRQATGDLPVIDIRFESYRRGSAFLRET